jgi:hydroxymethylglutaryl-CoA reductase
MTQNGNKKFYKMSVHERLDYLVREAELTREDITILQENLSVDAANHMVENVIGVHGLPLGIAQNFVVNNRAVFVPMVIEEPSVVAGASFMAKLALGGGGFKATSTPPEMIGQIQLLDVEDLDEARAVILEHKDMLLDAAAGIHPGMIYRGGGPRDLEVRLISDSAIGPFLVIHLIYDVQDVMGANVINTVAEHLAPRIEDLTGGRVHLRILSNLTDRRMTRSSVTILKELLAFGDYSGEQVRDGIIEAWAFAAVDPYRAATHNKGIMNGVDAVVMATANDWRAIEAGAHAYAARSGHYTSLSTWGKDDEGNLVGSLEMPMAVGIVGGSTKTHPGARACIKLMGVRTAGELAEIIVSVGLAQNLAALRALATEGIQKGHMALHARKANISMPIGSVSEIVGDIKAVN